MKNLKTTNQGLQVKSSQHVHEIIRNYSESELKIIKLDYELKIRHFNQNNKGYNKLEEHIYIWCKFLGVKDLDETNAQMLVAFLKETFKDFSVKEISHALMLGLKGTIPVEMEHYQNFSPIYLSKILNSYKIYRNKLVLKYNKENEEYLELKNKKIPTKKETLNNIYLITLNLFQEFINDEEDFKNDEFRVIQISVIYDLLLSNKIIKGIDADKFKKIKKEFKSFNKVEYLTNFFLRLNQKNISLKDYFLKKLS